MCSFKTGGLFQDRKFQMLYEIQKRMNVKYPFCIQQLLINKFWYLLFQVINFFIKGKSEIYKLPRGGKVTPEEARKYDVSTIA